MIKNKKYDRAVIEQTRHLYMHAHLLRKYTVNTTCLKRVYSKDWQCIQVLDTR